MPYNYSVIKKSFLLTTTMTILFYLLFMHPSLEAAEHKNQILLLHSYHQGYKWTDNITEGVLSVLKDKADLRIEYMDTKRYLGIGGVDSEEYLNLLDRILGVKHREAAYDLIITADNLAFDFFLTFGRKTFPDVPIVFCGVNNLDLRELARDSNITGVNEAADIASSFAMIREVFPERKDLICITDISTTGEILRLELELEAYHNRDGYDSIKILQNLSMEELEKTLTVLDGDRSVVFYTFFFWDRDGNFFEYDEGARRVSRAAEKVGIPVVGAWDFAMGEGIMGGHLVSGFEQGRIAAEKALETLEAGSAGLVDIVQKSPHLNVFDFTKLKQFDLSLGDLPTDYILINQPQSLFYTHRNEIVALLAFIILLIFLIILLNRSNRLLDRKVEEKTRSLRMAQKQLIVQERQAAIGSLMAGMAHEINTPLGIAITSSSHLDRKLRLTKQKLENETLTREDLDSGLADFHEGLDLTLGNLKRAASLVDNFKTIADDENLQTVVVFNLKEYMRDLIEAYERSFAENDIRIVLKGEEITIRSRQDYFFRILTNILLNSKDHAFPMEMPEEKIIRITIRTDDSDSDFAVIEYEDTGVGISPEIREVLFEPFTTTGRHSGKIGLGLHKVYKLVTEKLEGTIENPADHLNSPMKGVHFLIRFPKVTAKG